MQQATTLIPIEIGERTFRTSVETLKRIPFLNKVHENLANASAGTIRVDRSPEMFQYILDHARGYSLSYPSNFESKVRLIEDCEYYGTDGLLDEIVDSFTDDEKKIFSTTSESTIEAYKHATECVSGIGKLELEEDTNGFAESTKTQEANWAKELETLIAPLVGEGDVLNILASRQFSRVQMNRIVQVCEAVSSGATWARSFFYEVGRHTSTVDFAETLQARFVHHATGSTLLSLNVRLQKLLMKLMPTTESIKAIVPIILRLVLLLVQHHFPRTTDVPAPGPPDFINNVINGPPN